MTAELTRQLADMKAEVEAKETALIDQAGKKTLTLSTQHYATLPNTNLLQP